MFGATEERADAMAFARSGVDDRHHFRFIVAPEDAAEMTDLKAFTRDLVSQMERDLPTRLDWVAVDHWNTDNPHVHLLVRGVAEDGSDLVISRDYWSRTESDRSWSMRSAPRGRARWKRSVGRASTSRSGWPRTTPDSLTCGRRIRAPSCDWRRAGRWIVDLDAERALRDLSTRGDIIKIMHRAFTDRGQDRGIADYVIDSGTASSPIIGHLVDTGLHDELTGEA